MPRLRRLEFVQDRLAVSYRATAEPQLLDVHIATAARSPEPGGAVSMQALLDAINAGAAGGSIFAPEGGSAEVVSGPPHDGREFGPEYRWRLGVAGVAPLFMRNFVEELRRAGWQAPVTSMQLVGSLPVDSSPLSVREPHVRAWLEDDAAYVDEWPRADFRINEGSAPSTVVRVKLEEPIAPDVRARLEALAVTWLNASRNYVSEDGEEVEFDPLRTLPRFGRGKSELCARFDGWRYKRAPSRALLVNMLQRFHSRVARVTELEFRS